MPTKETGTPSLAETLFTEGVQQPAKLSPHLGRKPPKRALRAEQGDAVPIGPDCFEAAEARDIDIDPVANQSNSPSIFTGLVHEHEINPT